MVVCDCGSAHVNEKLEMFASCEDGIVSSSSVGNYFLCNIGCSLQKSNLNFGKIIHHCSLPLQVHYMSCATECDSFSP